MENGQSKGYPNKFTTRELAAFNLNLGPGRLAVSKDGRDADIIYRKVKPPIRELKPLLASHRARGGRAAI